MKTMLSSVLFAVIAIIAAMFYSMGNSDIEDLILCTSHNESHYIPRSQCKSYLYNYRGNKEDINYPESRLGISFIFGLDDVKDIETHFDFLISKNIDINKISPADGFTPLHAAVLENKHLLVKKLLESDADKTIFSSATNSTSLELAQ